MSFQARFTSCKPSFWRFEGSLKSRDKTRRITFRHAHFRIRMISNSGALGESAEPWTIQVPLGSLVLQNEPHESLADYDWLIHLFPQVDKKALNRTYMNEPFQMKHIVCPKSIKLYKWVGTKICRVNSLKREKRFWEISTFIVHVRPLFLMYAFLFLRVQVSIIVPSSPNLKMRNQRPNVII